MKVAEILATLRKAGKPETAAIYKRHGSGDDVFGVLTSEIARLRKKVGVDHALGLDLWKTGNAEVRILAILVFDPKKITRAEADRLVEEGQVHFLACYLSDLLARSPIAEPVMRAWMSPRRRTCARSATASSARGCATTRTRSTTRTPRSTWRRSSARSTVRRTGRATR